MSLFIVEGMWILNLYIIFIMLFLNHPAVHPAHNTRSAEEYLKSLSSSNESQRYFSNESQYKSNWWNKLKMWTSPDMYLKELINFYPHQTTISTTLHQL